MMQKRLGSYVITRASQYPFEFLLLHLSRGFPKARERASTTRKIPRLEGEPWKIHD